MVSSSTVSSQQQQQQPPPRSPGLDWTEYYAKSEQHYKFRVKSVHLPTFAYECYVFQADLTELNCDVLVNASNASLHPGYYSGDGVSRRVREKGGKKMQDSLKKTLSQISPRKLVDSDVVLTKSHGRLRSQYVLHAVTPSWSKYVLERQNVNGFEPCMESTLHNVLLKAHTCALEDQHQQHMCSIGFPVASAKVGGAFDMPVALFAHLLYTQLAQFEYEPATMNLELSRVCVCSMEPDVVSELCDVFASYAEMCDMTLWALPQSPMNTLVHEIYPNEFDLLTKSITTESYPLSPPSSQAAAETNPSVAATATADTTLTDLADMSSIISTTIDEQHKQQHAQNISTTSTSSSDESVAASSEEHNFKNVSLTTTQSIPIPTNQSTSPSSNAESQTPPTSAAVVSSVSSVPNYFCVFCQDEKNLFRCDNPTCTSAFCSKCISKQINKATSSTATASKCPGCKHLVSPDLLTRISTATTSEYPSSSSSSSSSSSLSISPVRIQQQQQQIQQQQAHPQPQKQQQQYQPTPPPYVSARRFNHSGSSSTGGGVASSPPSTPPSASTPPSRYTSSSSLHSHAKYPFCDAKIYIRQLEQPCEGYEDFKSILITFDVPDGIQNSQHPKPGQPYKGTVKRAYLPEIKEHVDILAFYERALKAGLLFKLEWSRPSSSSSANYGEFRVLLNQDIILKTSQRGGGRFGYPDPTYIDNMLNMAHNISFN